MTEQDNIIKNITEVCKLYNISIAEQIIMIQIIGIVQNMGIPLELSSKLFSALGVVTDLMVKEKK